MATFFKPFCLLLLLCLFIHQALSIPQFGRSSMSALSSEEGGKIWVVLVTGSSGFRDYMDQASVCHAWHMFVDNGVNPDNIITMMHDDVAYSAKNPYPGKLFNRPNGNDVYEGVRIDYKGEDVSPTNFMAILLGNATTTNGKPVLKSTKHDKVFVYLSGHGGRGIVSFADRSPERMTVKNMAKTLKGMYEKKMYKELTFYLTSCESGSMFGNYLPENIYAVSSTNANEPGWNCYCFTKLLPTACLGDVFSDTWMEDTEGADLKGRTLAEQFKVLQYKTLYPTTTGDIVRGSHVQAFGNLSIQKEFLSEFMGNGKAPYNSSSKNMKMLEYSGTDEFNAYSSWDIPLLMLKQQQKNGMKNDMKIQMLLKNRRYLEEQMNELVKKVLQKENPIMQDRYANLISPQGITQMECHHQIMHAFNDKCFNFATSPYALKYTYMLVNLCELGIDEKRIKATMMEHCANLDTKLEIV